MDVLIVEDEAAQCRTRAEYVQSLGFSSTCRPNAITALEACTQTFYPIIITELGLSDMDGLEFCRRIRALSDDKGEDSMILVVSERSAPEDMLMAFTAGADDYLVKPAASELLGKHVMKLKYRFERWSCHPPIATMTRTTITRTNS